MKNRTTTKQQTKSTRDYTMGFKMK